MYFFFTISMKKNILHVNCSTNFLFFSAWEELQVHEGDRGPAEGHPPVLFSWCQRLGSCRQLPQVSPVRRRSKMWNKTGGLEIPSGVVKAQLVSWLVTMCQSRKKKNKNGKLVRLLLAPSTWSVIRSHLLLLHGSVQLLRVSCVHLSVATFLCEVT